MTYEEAKKHLNLIRKGFGAVIEFGTAEEAIKHYNNFKDIEIILKALEKQIAKTPEAIRTRYSGAVKKGICPNCLMAEDNSANYCRACGQRLDWGE